MIGKYHGERVKNDTGSRLLGFSAENEFSIINIYFEHKEFIS